MTLQARSRRRFQIYSDTRLDHDDFNVPLTKSRFLKTIRRRLQCIKSTRYLHRAARYRISTYPDWVLNDQLLSERQFKEVYRMTRSSFQTLLEQTWQHPIFYNNSNRPQRPLKYQFQVALYHFGGGACGSRIRTAIQFGSAEGTVEIYVHRVTVAILALQER